jgi:hypothetical protein
VLEHGESLLPALALVAEAAAFARDVAVETSDLIGRDLPHRSELGLLGLAEVGFGALGSLAADTDGGQYRQRAVVAVKLHETVLVQLAQITDVVKVVAGVARGTLVKLLQIFDQILQMLAAHGGSIP